MKQFRHHLNTDCLGRLTAAGVMVDHQSSSNSVASADSSRFTSCDSPTHCVFCVSSIFHVSSAPLPTPPPAHIHTYTPLTSSSALSIVPLLKQTKFCKVKKEQIWSAAQRHLIWWRETRNKVFVDILEFPLLVMFANVRGFSCSKNNLVLDSLAEGERCQVYAGCKCQPQSPRRKQKLSSFIREL